MTIRSIRRARLTASIILFIVYSAVLHGQTAGTYRPHLLPKSLGDQAAEAVQKGDMVAARDLYERWLKADPRDNSAWYNLACIYALAGEKELALDAFESAVDAGWSDASHPTRDTDLDAIRFDPRFAAALRRIGKSGAAKGPKGFIRHYAEMKSRGSYIVMLPPDYETSTKEYPICVILHGSGSTELAHGRLADTMGREGVIYIAPRAPYPHPEVVASGAMGWDARPPEAIDTNDPNYARIPIDYVDWIFTCVDEVQQHYRARKGKVFLYGHSQGGGYANIATLLHPERVAAYFSQAGSLPGERFLNAVNARRMKEQGVRAYLMHGESDNTVPPTSSKTIDAVLTEAGVEHTLRLVPGDHGINGAMLSDTRAWVDREVRGSR
jgi:predicted esterase